MSPISDAGVERLVEAAFYASLLQDEGRWPRCRLRNAAGHPWSRVVTLRRAPVAADTISRLAAVCHSAEHALSIIEEDGALQCDGLVDTGPMGLDGLPGRPEIVSGASPVALDVQILGPGRLVVRDRGSLLNCELRGGRLRLLSSIWHAPQVRALFDAFGRRCLDAAAPEETDPARDYFGGAHGVTWLTCALFGPVLAGMVHAGHGGAIIIVPRAASLEGAVEFGSEVRDLDLKAEIAAYWSACLTYAPDSDGASIGRWQRVRARLRSKFASLVGLTSVDGCIILDDDLRVRRIGAQITVEDARAEASGRPFRCSISGEAHDYRQFMDELGGTRHRSAARLCAAIEGAVAFVVSQDGGLTLFCGDESSTFGYGPMDADWWG
ncbi:MAG: putative sensor domain DACNV-containing protein [Phycisphaerales bacterium JB039]